MIEVEGADGSKAYLNPTMIAAVMPAAEKGVPVIGSCIIFMGAGIPPIVVKDSPANMVARIEADEA